MSVFEDLRNGKSYDVRDEKYRVVTKDVPDNAVVVGVPAKIVKTLD